MTRFIIRDAINERDCATAYLAAKDFELMMLGEFSIWPRRRSRWPLAKQLTKKRQGGREDLQSNRPISCDDAAAIARPKMINLRRTQMGQRPDKCAGARLDAYVRPLDLISISHQPDSPFTSSAICPALPRRPSDADKTSAQKNTSRVPLIKVMQFPCTNSEE